MRGRTEGNREASSFKKAGAVGGGQKNMKGGKTNLYREIWKYFARKFTGWMGKRLWGQLPCVGRKGQRPGK